VEECRQYFAKDDGSTCTSEALFGSGRIDLTYGSLVDHCRFQTNERPALMKNGQCSAFFSSVDWEMVESFG